MNDRMKNAFYVTVISKVSDDLSQKPTKLIRTELVKMMSESSLLRPDLESIHQSV